MSLRVPVTLTDAKDWTRKAANAINDTSATLETLNTAAIKHNGIPIYPATTASATYTQAEIQALMDALKALSDRLT